MNLSNSLRTQKLRAELEDIILDQNGKIVSLFAFIAYITMSEMRNKNGVEDS